MLRVVDIVYHCHTEYDQPASVLAKHQPTIGFIPYLKDRVHYTVIRHLNYEGKQTTDGIRYAFFKRRNAAWQVPFKTHRYIKSLKPDIVLVHGFIFPLQLITLKIRLGKKPALIVQHHAEQPVNSVRKIFQKIADRYISAYMFTSAAIAAPWLRHGVIRDKNKVIELPGASVVIEKKDKAACKQKLGMSGNSNFLWVGRLNENKDPHTILKAFAQYTVANPAAALFMIYHTEELLETVKETIHSSQQLCNHVHLIGTLAHDQLADWYHAADFFISGSHAEAAGYALLEAMSAGCVPVVTSIPSYKKFLHDGAVGFMFDPGDIRALVKLLQGLMHIDAGQHAIRVKDHFEKYLGFKNIAEGMFALFNKLQSVQS